ncbi:MAG TPA: galactokinase family protein, partial [Anaerolineales bacterium]|nr:galactokinase family protein [Anaerolineales bacterium]
MRTIFSPYRICPIGAHVDHQGGAVLGRTIDIGTSLEYEPSDTSEIYITSNPFGEARFSSGSLDTNHWARYAQAAARVLNASCGMRARASGPFIGSGLSSSASVGLAYLKALADVNGIDLSKQDLVRLDYELEQGELGLQNGLLDPLTIVYGRKDALLLMDTIRADVTPIPDPSPPHFAWIVAYSGVSRELTKSRFNIRVEESRQAAALLLDGAQILSDVPHEIFEGRKRRLPETHRRRAEHYFTEVDR